LPTFNQPGMQGWMLANLAAALRNTKRYEDMRRVSEHALTLPRDHSVWWHRNFLAFASYLDGDLDRAEELAVVPVDGYWAQKVDALAIRILVEMERRRGFFARRRLLIDNLPEYLDCCRAAEQDDGSEPEFAADVLYDKIFCDVTCLMLMGSFGRKWLERLYVRRR